MSALNYRNVQWKRNYVPWTNAFRPEAETLVNYITKGAGKGIGWHWLANISDTFGNRMTGSQRLEDAIDYLVPYLKAQGFDNVHTEDVPNLPRWVRGEETVTLLQPRNYKMGVLSPGGTVPTPPEGITAEAVVVRSFKELQALGRSKVEGKILVYNQPWVNYGIDVAYRSGANQASWLGAKAVLIRSVTSFSVYSPHTGEFSYRANTTKIPAACITVEDAEMLWRMQNRGQKLKIHIKIASQMNGTVTSRNTIFEIAGSTKPEEIVLLTCHFDSWDVGEGAMDDGGGCALMWQALTSIKALAMRPKRTIRVIFFTAEELGWLGVDYYYSIHKNWKNETFVFVSESDGGAFRPTSNRALLKFNGTDAALKNLEDITSLIRSLSIPISLARISGSEDMGQVTYWTRKGIPGVIYVNEDTYDKYFIFHHTKADMMTVLKPDDIDYTSAVYGTLAYVVANMTGTLQTGP